jgi:hypothetical protein
MFLSASSRVIRSAAIRAPLASRQVSLLAATRLPVAATTAATLSSTNGRFFSDGPTMKEPRPPAAMDEEIAMGIQRATQMYMRHGIGKQRLDEIYADSSMPFIARWQKMMESFLGTQVHILAGLGYSPDENGMGLYNHQLGTWLQNSDPDTQERMRTMGRDIWREVLCTTFRVKEEDLKDLDIVEARKMMYRVSEKMQDDTTLELIAKKCEAIEPDTDEQLKTAAKHGAVQDVLVNHVYIGGEPSIVSEFGFGEGEEGYVILQCAMADHQSDPLVAQYVGTAMMKIMNAAGLDMGQGAAPPAKS